MLTTHPEFALASFRFSRTSEIQIVFSEQEAIAQLCLENKYLNLDSKNIIITDENVASCHLESIQKAFQDEGAALHPVIISPNESSKSFSVYAQCVESILEIGIDKYSTIVSFGGGVVNNLAGFLASTIYRGLNLIHIPTTTLSQSDAAIDVKQAINSSFGKNTVGAYYPPKAVVISVDFLRTLPRRYFFDGFAEIIKHALCQDRDFLGKLLKLNTDDFDARLLDYSRIDRIIRQAIHLKVEVMGEYADPGANSDDYNEAIKQYGHSLGHAIEHATNHALLHGEAISIGMSFSAFVANQLGIANQHVLADHIEVFRHFHLPTAIPDTVTNQDLIRYIEYDKHFANGCVSLGFLKAIGQPYFSTSSASYFSQLKLDDFEQLLIEFRTFNSHENSISNRW